MKKYRKEFSCTCNRKASTALANQISNLKSYQCFYIPSGTLIKSRDGHVHNVEQDHYLKNSSSISTSYFHQKHGYVRGRYSINSFVCVLSGQTEIVIGQNNGRKKK